MVFCFLFTLLLNRNLAEQPTALRGNAVKYVGKTGLIKHVFAINWRTSAP